MNIEIKYVRDIEKIEMKPNGDWVDLRAGEEIFLMPNEYINIPLGIAMKFPDKYEAHIVPRSSTFKNWGILLVNGVGIIDHTYCGNDDEWMFPALATRATVIKKNDRICQFRLIERQEDLTFIETDDLKSENRGGLGSTGKK